MTLANIISTIPANANIHHNLPNKTAIIYYLRLEFNNINGNSVVNNNNNLQSNETVGRKTAVNTINIANNNATIVRKMAASQLQSNNSNVNTNNSTQNGNKIAVAPLILYKIGYTTTSINERVFGVPDKTVWRTNRRTGRRIATVRKGHVGLGIPPNTNIFIISTAKCVSASIAYQKEQVLHAMHKSDKYNGLPLLANGNTELYTSDVLLLDGW